MDYFKTRFEKLFTLYQTGNCSEEERIEFLDLITKDENQPELNQLLKKAIREANADQTIDPVIADKIYNNIIGNSTEEDLTTKSSKVIGLKQLLVAASAVLLIGIGIFQKFRIESKSTSQVKQSVSTSDLIKPGTNNAILTLSDGSTIVLDKTADGAIALQGNIEVKKINGQIKYEESTDKGEQVYNTITTTRGNQYEVVLSDGSKVWLNASSSLRFPNYFKGDERDISITGEAYFEVAHNPKSPFKVNVNGIQVTVLGTHFNINAYDNESSVKTTLLEGSVRISKGSSMSVLIPGQQASVGSNDFINIKSNVDIDEVVAWKNGSFVFNRQDIKSIMRQIERWYNVEAVYKDDITKETFSGIVSRKMSVEQVLKIMEENGVKFKIEGRKIIVQ